MTTKEKRTILFYIVSVAWMMMAFALIFSLPGTLTITTALVKILAMLAAVLMLKGWYYSYLVLRAKRLINKID